MENILFYMQHYLSPSMTFIYRQLSGVKQEWNTHVLCSRIFENCDIFPHDKLFFSPHPKLISKYYRIKEILFNRPSFNYINISPSLMAYKRNQYENFIRKNDCRLIHAHFGPSGIEVLPIARELNLPLLVSFHGFDASSLLQHRDYLNNLEKLFKYAHIITPSEKMITILHKHGLNSKKEYVVHYGIPLDVFSFQKRKLISQKLIDNEEITFLQVSNFVEKKGHKYTVQAFNNFIKEYPNSRLILAGDGPLKNSIIDLANELGILEKVEFPGLVYQDKVKELMVSADVFVHHSITSKRGETEGIPNAIMEAMATGLPVISTIHAAIPELIDDGVNGYLVPEKDIGAYELAMKKILKIGENFGKNGRRKIEREFNSEIENGKLISIYKNLLN